MIPTRRLSRALQCTVIVKCSKSSASVGSVPTQSSTEPQKLDAETIEKLRVAEEIGEKAFEENTEILKKMMLRGLRALVVGIGGFVAFTAARKRRARIDDAANAAVEPDDDPTQKYLNEMRSLGFDVDGLEDELANEKKSAGKKV